MKPRLVAAIALISAISVSGSSIFADRPASSRGSTVGAGHGGSLGLHSTAGFGGGAGNRISSGPAAVHSSGYVGRSLPPSGSSRSYGRPNYSPGRSATVDRTGVRYPVTGVTRPANVNHDRSLHTTAGVRPNQNQKAATQTATAMPQPGNGRDRQLTRQDTRPDLSRLDAQTGLRLRDYKGRKPNFAEARHFHDNHTDGHDGHDGHNRHDGHHCYHNKDWWHQHCPVIVWSGWGWWGWDAGWWYPAWGYDPYYSYYAYDEPIFSYDGLTPDQIIANVQSALQDEGYYPYAVDGVMGSLTQEALGNYQRDHGLSVTGAIDEPTLLALGLGN
jgi:Putative peptidoglycan binding domain